MIPGFIEVEISNLVKAGGALAVFVIVFFFSPAQLAVSEIPKTIGFIASSEGEAFAIRGRFNGEATVSAKEVNVKVEEGTISFPVPAHDGGNRYVEYVSAGLACDAGGSWNEVSHSQPLAINKPLRVGQVENLGKFELIIPRSGREISGCWLSFNIAAKMGIEDRITGFSYAHSQRGIF
jgi:hypothetical protein